MKINYSLNVNCDLFILTTSSFSDFTPGAMDFGTSGKFGMNVITPFSP